MTVDRYGNLRPLVENIRAFILIAGIASAISSSSLANDANTPRYSAPGWTEETIALDKASGAARKYAENNYGVGILIHLGQDVPNKRVKDGDELGALFVGRFAEYGVKARYFIAPNDAPATGMTYHIGHLLYEANNDAVMDLQTAWDDAPKVIERLKAVKELTRLRSN